MLNSIKNTLTKQTHIAPLAVFRTVFGAIMLFSTLRFMANGWVHDMYVEPKFFFTYFGFEWVKPLPELGMYLLFSALAISFLFQAAGIFYKAASIFSFLGFTYVELIDKTNYLNHYYFVSLILFLLVFVPAHRYFSIDVLRRPSLKIKYIPNYYLLIFKLQLTVVYFYAGLAKLNSDWLLEALPLKMWLPAKTNLPVIGGLLAQKWVAYIFSWFGAIYDLSIAFLLFNRRTVGFAYFLVVAFHMITWLLFPIGVFPFVMIGATLIFFPEKFHQRLIEYIQKFKLSLSEVQILTIETAAKVDYSLNAKVVFFSVFMLIQLLVPFRYALYPDNLYWTEEGYRFSWRVMLMEKAGYAIFHISDPSNGRTWEINNYDYLTPNQEKMMSTQADLILQFAHYLETEFKEQGIENPTITAEVYATLNGNPSQLLIDPTVDLTNINESFLHKNWILPFKKTPQHQ